MIFDTRYPYMTKAVTDVILERVRQVTGEGFSADHDDEHDSGELAGAASGYARAAVQGIRDEKIELPLYWPWDIKWWKPASPRRMLVKAAALIIAEIERIDRNSPKETK